MIWEAPGLVGDYFPSHSYGAVAAPWQYHRSTGVLGQYHGGTRWY